MHGDLKTLGYAENAGAGGRMKYDVVYILKKDADTDEIRYSLRSVEKNFPYRKVWIFGGCPDGIAPDEFVPFEQTGDSKWQKATSTYRKICETEGVTEDFWMFNDDFFIMKPVDDLPYMYNGTLEDKVEAIRKDAPWARYGKSLEEARKELEDNGFTSLNYALHVPMLFNKAKIIETLDRFRSPMFRSLYGNYCNVGGVEFEDVKINNLEGVPPEDCVLLSTSDRAFVSGACGKVIRARFTERSKWETR